MANRPIPDDLRISWQGVHDVPAPAEAMSGEEYSEPYVEKRPAEQSTATSVQYLVERIDWLTEEVARLNAEARERTDIMLGAVAGLRDEIRELARRLDLRPSVQAHDEAQIRPQSDLALTPPPSEEASAGIDLGPAEGTDPERAHRGIEPEPARSWTE